MNVLDIIIIHMTDCIQIMSLEYTFTFLLPKRRKYVGIYLGRYACAVRASKYESEGRYR